MKEEFGTRMYDTKYTLKTEDVPRSVVTSFVDNYLTKDQHCLDLGCGAGRHSKYLAEKSINVTAVDMSQKGVEKTKEILKGFSKSSVMVADGQHLPFEDESFDSLISNRVLDYNNDEGLEVVFAEIERIIKTNGIILITVRSISQPSKQDEILIKENNDGGKTFRVKSGLEQGVSQHYFSEQEIRNLAKLHNFEIKDIHEQQKTNKKGEQKSEWQVIMQKVKSSETK